MKKTVIFLHIAILAPFLLLAFFLFRFQILEGEKYQRIAEHNFVRVQRVLPIRGEIFDRNFNPIAFNTASTNLYVLPVKIKDLSEVAGFVSSYFPLSEEEIRQMVFQQRFRSYQELLLVQNVPYETVVEVSEKLTDYPALFFRNEHIRSYPHNNHFTGYVNKISPAELEEMQGQDYSINSLIGKNGLEKQYEALLKGSVGYRVVQVDATGRSYQIFKHNLTTPPINGSDILLTIDGRLQNYIESIFPENHNGAIVVLDPQTGGILAYVSRPVFNLNIFSETIGTEYWSELVNNPAAPLLDRVTMSSYPPASVFKTIIAAAALDNKIVTPDKKMPPCHGSFRYGNRTFNCWRREGHGTMNLIDGLKHSCNVYFYNLSLELPLSMLYNYIMDIKLTSRTGIDLPTEKNGLFPSEQWYANRNIHRSIIPGHKINLVIGQGEVLLTPIQIASFFAAIANDGLWKQPYLFSRIIGSSNNSPVEEIVRKREDNQRHLPITPETMAVLQDALSRAVQEQGGTGGAARARGVKVYGKTGTGQNPGGFPPNAWFAGYAAWQRPELAMAIIVERVKDGSGGSTAAPIAGRIIRYYDENIRNERITANSIIN